MPKTVYIIVGPTAVGKTTFALQLANHLQTEIISADARQCYKELNIGVARPTIDELNMVPHHFMASHSIQEEVNAAVFEQYALAHTNIIFEKNNAVVMVGGTGLYIKSFCEGLDAIPAIDASVRERIINLYRTHGLPWLQAQVALNDPLYWEQCEQQNPQRLMRALEVKLGSGDSILAFQNKAKPIRPFEIVKIGIQMPMEQLYYRINQRVLNMFDVGLEKEVYDLQSHKGLNALQTVGYKEWIPYFEGQISKAKVLENIQLNTRHYAKRQMTWFRKDPSVQWFEAADISPAMVGL